MKFYKKISLFISLVITLICIPNFATAKNNVNVDDSFKLNVLESLNILSVSDLNTDFSEESKVTRGQFAVYVARLMGLFIEDTSGDVLFEDVSKSHYAFGAVRALSEKNVIHGSGGNFYPDTNITYEQAIKIMVSALGYGMVADRKGGYPYGYNSTAKDIDLLESIAIKQGEELTKTDTIRLLYNSLDIAQLSISVFGKDTQFAPDEKKTFLAFRDISKYKGQVVSNAITSISSSNAAPSDSVKIGDYYFKCGETNISDYLGQVVSVYYKSDSNDMYTVLFIEKSFSEVIDVPAANIEKFDNWQYRYKESDVDKSIRVSSSCYIIYNGRIPVYFNMSYMTPNSGKVRIIDNSNNNSEDVIIITNVEDYMITSAEKNGYTLYSENQPPKSLNSKDFYLYSANGNAVPFDTIKEGDIVSVAESDDGKCAILYISDKKVIGDVVTIESEDGYSNIVIGGTSYRLLTGVSSIPKVNDRVILSINFFGDIGYITKDEEDGLSFGYIIKHKKIRKEDTVSIEILTEKGDFESFYVADKVRINDQTYRNDPDGVIAEIDALNDDHRIIKYELNSDKRIKNLYIYNTTNKNYIHDTDVSVSKPKYKYRREQRTFGDTDAGGQITLSENAIVFIVPADKSKSTVQTDARFSNEDTFYAVKCFSFGDTPYADIVLFDQDSVTYEKYLALVQKTVKILDEEEGEIKTQICVLMQGKEQEFLLEDESLLTGVERGDVIRIAFSNLTGEIRGLKIIYDKSMSKYVPTANPCFTDSAQTSNGYYGSKRVVYAGVDSTEKGLLKIDRLDITTDMATGNQENCLMSQFTIYKYDDDKDKWDIGKTADIRAGKKLLVGTDWAKPTEIIILN